MSQVPRYESYKDSGVQWLGEIPSHWVVTRLKFMAKIKNGSDYKHVQTEEGYPVIGSGGQFTYATDYLYKGESVLLGRKGTIDKPLYVNCAFWTVDTMYYTEILDITFPKFLYYCALTVDFWKYSTQTALPSMTQTALSNLIFATPKYDEQKNIADFLDKRLAQVDALIVKQETLLNKLAEQRVALISHAVTKGLNPDIEMRNSRINELGKVPRHWTETRLKFMAKIQNGCDYKHVQVDEGYPVIGSGGQFTYASEFLYQGESVLLGRKGTIDKPLYVNEAFWTVDTMYYTEILESTFPKFLYYCALTIDFWKYSTQTALPSMTQTVLSNLYFAIPKYDEQKDIAEYLDKKTSELDRHCKKVVEILDKLKEYRSTLIAQVVTGKIDVRNLQIK